MLQIISFYWKYNSYKNKYSQWMSLYDHAEGELKKVPLEHYAFNFALSEKRFCIGWSDNEGYHACPFGNELTKKSYERCKFCEDKQGFKAAFFFGAEPNDHMRKHLSQTHVIYLAFFPPNIIKVGTAAESRKKLRLVEQDARGYMFIAESDGFTIQKLERYISKRFNITESVKSITKLKNIHIKPDNASIKLHITSNANKIISSLSSHEEFSNWVYNKNDLKLVDLANTNIVYYPDKNIQVTLIKDELVLAGIFKGLRAKFVLIQNNGMDVAFNTSWVKGRYVENYVTNYKYKNVNQQLALL